MLQNVAGQIANKEVTVQFTLFAKICLSYYVIVIFMYQFIFSGVRAGPWREEHELELRELFDRYRNSDGEISP